MRTKITPLRLSDRIRGILLRKQRETGRSLCALVSHLVDMAVVKPGRWPRRLPTFTPVHR
jgi:hypothetical protein